MEKRISFDEWLENYTPTDPVYYAIYNPDTGEVTGISPDYAAQAENHKVLVDTEIAEDIFAGRLRLSSCVVDQYSGSVDIAEVKNLVKIDDVLHRIVDKKYTEVNDPDLFVTYDRASSKLIFELGEKFFGTKKSSDGGIKKRKVHWDGDTVMNFLITEYNDPNILTHTFSFKISELIDNQKSFDNIKLPSKFSIYTRRLLKKYIFEEL